MIMTHCDAQVAYEVVPTHAALNRFVYKHVPVYDTESEDIVSAFESSFAFIREARDAGVGVGASVGVGVGVCMCFLRACSCVGVLVCVIRL